MAINNEDIKLFKSQRLVLRIIRRTCNTVGQMFLSSPDYELEGWWTTLAGGPSGENRTTIYSALRST
ncbi:hypothetical protein [Sansalvadorimonas verongulae]|uniref:hypothetical protein n=1 Tax=Sansalvadorimonas verongulae TaxID=2172824 RepID=UPI0018AD22AE|nr:hypothetical protein [Sansalvadorimonas verongulae]